MNSIHVSVAMLEDNDVDACLLELMLRKAWPDIEVRRHILLADLLADLEQGCPPVVLADLCVPDASGVTIVEQVRAVSPLAAIVVLTGDEDPGTAEAVLCAGAQDYLEKGRYDLDALSRAIRYSMARADSETKLHRTAAALAQSNEELNQYAGVVAHDLRAPVRTARLLADRLVASADSGAKSMDMAARLDEVLNRLEGLVDGLLKLSSIRDGSVKRIPVSLTSAAADVVDDLRADIDACGATVHISADVVVQADPLLMRELLRNVLENSIKYRDQTRPLIVNIDAIAGSPQVELDIWDNGIGIEPEYRSSVFRLFERLHGPTSGIPGLGVGLALCQRIISLHDGTIRVGEPRDGVGTSIVISLPLECARCEPATTGESQPEPDTLALAAMVSTNATSSS